MSRGLYKTPNSESASVPVFAPTFVPESVSAVALVLISASGKNCVSGLSSIGSESNSESNAASCWRRFASTRVFYSEDISE